MVAACATAGGAAFYVYGVWVQHTTHPILILGSTGVAAFIIASMPGWLRETKR
jgi:hypothetical protein